ncbi:hypothetical protein [Streptomyces filamentosus]|uniref:hypothetical protein n=1 Tax=Streptomyces filamentosus TaxID=67294 RepID=UPI0033CDC38D
MFSKLRRKHRSAPARPATPPAPPSAPELGLADERAIARVERFRRALEEAGADLAVLGPEPGWFTQVRAGRSVPVGEEERAELITYLGTKSTAAVASDDACARAVDRVEAFTLLREMQAEGVTVRACRGTLSADALRAVRRAVRDAEEAPRELPAAG